MGNGPENFAVDIFVGRAVRDFRPPGRVDRRLVFLPAATCDFKAASSSRSVVISAAKVDVERFAVGDFWLRRFFFVVTVGRMWRLRPGYFSVTSHLADLLVGVHGTLLSLEDFTEWNASQQQGKIGNICWRQPDHDLVPVNGSQTTALGEGRRLVEQDGNRTNCHGFPESDGVPPRSGWAEGEDGVGENFVVAFDCITDFVDVLQGASFHLMLPSRPMKMPLVAGDLDVETWIFRQLLQAQPGFRDVVIHVSTDERS